MSLPLQNWLKSKNAESTDLPFISLLKTDLQKSILVQVIEQFNLLRPSFSEGIKILELTTELILMNSSEEIFEHTTSVASWMTHLNKLRYPVTATRDDELEKKMLSMPWPYGSKVKFERRGDRAGVELKMFITSEADLIKTLSALERVKEQISVGPSK